MRRYVIAFVVLGLSAAMLAIAAPLFSQSSVTTATLQGRVGDATGGALAGASVTARNLDTGFSRSVTAEADGSFRIPLLPVGPYLLTIELPGFSSFTREGLVLTVGATVALGEITLEVATVQETITVSAESPLVETGRSVVAATFEESAIHNLPINGRDFQDFATLTPTVVKERGRDTISMGGQKGIDTNITLDGADFNNAFFGQATGQPEAKQFVISQEAVKEFVVLSNGYSAEFGRSGGGVINVLTKSGTNEVSGSGFFFGRTEAMTSTLDTVDGTTIPKTDFSQQQFGGSIGGPIVKDRAHFFASVDQQLFTSPFQVDFATDVSQVPPLTELFGQPISGVDDLASLEGTFQREINLTAFLAKVDVQLNASNTLTLRYNFSRFRGINFGASAGGVQGAVQISAEGTTEDTTDTSHSFVVSNTTIIGSNKFNELRFQYSTESRPRNGTSNEVPFVTIGGCCSWGRQGFLPIISDHPRIQFTDNFTYLFDDHDLKLGVDLNFTNTSQGFFGFSGGEYTFSSLADFQAGRVQRFRQLVGLNGFTTQESGTVDFSQQEYAVYVQDTWRPSPTVTLNLGLRWEGLNNPEVPTEEFGKPTTNPLDPGAMFGLDQQAVNDNWNNWAPRFGVAWDPKNDGRTVVRGGAGIFYSRIPLLLLANILTNNGYRQATADVRSGFPLPFPEIFPESGLPPGDPLEARLPPPDVFFWAPDFGIPQIRRANVGVEREIVTNLTLGVDYVFADTIDNQRRVDVNLNPPTGFDAHGRGIFNFRNRPDPRFGRLAVNESTAKGRYQALILSARKRYSNRSFLQVFYTFSENLSDDDNERSATGIGPSQPENLDADWGRSDRDVPHRFVATGIYGLPFDINLGATLELTSGNPFNVLSGRDDNLDGLFNDRAVVDDSNRARAEAAGQDLPDGLQPRNSARNPSFYNVDLRVTKAFDFGEPGQLELLFELFNVFNNPNRRTSLGRLDLANFGSLNLIGESRQAQLGVRYRW